MHITYRTRNVYGNELMYVTDKSVADALQTLTNKKTISLCDMSMLAVLGHTFEEVI